METQSDIETLLQAQPRSRVGKLLGAAAAVGIFCAGGWAGEHLAVRNQASASPEAVQQLEQIIAKPKRGECSSSKEDCFATGCCDVVGYTCFTTTPGSAKCLKNCTPTAKRSCSQPQAIMDHILEDASWKGTSLYCFAVYTQNTGSTKPNHELENLKYAYSKGIHIFACDQYDVFSDVPASVGDGLVASAVTDTEADWHFAKRKSTGAWVNTGMFSSVWRAIAQGGKYQSADWVAKVDGDAVFIPNRLKRWVAGQMVPDRGIYLENCKYVQYGYFGNLEVFSKAAWQTLMENIDMCKSSLDWKVGVQDGKYGPMGEDLFAQTCLDKVGVRRVEAFDITTDGACPADRPEAEKKNKKWKPTCGSVSTAAIHPFKNTDEFIKCHWATVNAFGN